MTEEEHADLTPEVEQKLPSILELPFAEAIEALHGLERKTRIAKDDKANNLVCKF